MESLGLAQHGKRLGCGTLVADQVKPWNRSYFRAYIPGALNKELAGGGAWKPWGMVRLPSNWRQQEQASLVGRRDTGVRPVSPGRTAPKGSCGCHKKLESERAALSLQPPGDSHRSPSGPGSPSLMTQGRAGEGEEEFWEQRNQACSPLSLNTMVQTQESWILTEGLGGGACEPAAHRWQWCCWSRSHFKRQISNWSRWRMGP